MSEKEAATSRAEAPVITEAEMLIDRRLFALDETKWREFQAALDRPVQRKPRLAKLLSEQSAVEKKEELRAF